jgi:hypothetical protein
MEVTTPLASLPYKEQIKKKQQEVVIRIRAINQCGSKTLVFIYRAVILIPCRWAGDGSDDTPGSGSVSQRYGSSFGSGSALNQRGSETLVFIYCILIPCRWAGDGSDYAPGQPALQGADQEEAAGGFYPDPRIITMRIWNPVSFFTVFWSLQVMEVTTPLASLPYKEQIKKKQREVVLLLQQLEDVSVHYFFRCS